MMTKKAMDIKAVRSRNLCLKKKRDL